MEISDPVPSGSASVEGVFVERSVLAFYCSLSIHVTVPIRSQELEKFVLAFYCSLSIHATVLSRSQELERLVLVFYCSLSVHVTVVSTTALSGAHSGSPQ